MSEDQPSGATTHVAIRGNAGEDVGYLRDRQHWWFDPDFPHSFELFDLDGFYEQRYFESDHVDPAVAERFVALVQAR